MIRPCLVLLGLFLCAIAYCAQCPGEAGTHDKSQQRWSSSPDDQFCEGVSPALVRLQSQQEFTELLGLHESVLLVHQHSNDPQCQLCLLLQGELEHFVRKLRGAVVTAIVECSELSDLCADVEYPSLALFLFGHLLEEYEGPMHSPSIVKWSMRLLSPSVQRLDSSDSISRFANRNAFTTHQLSVVFALEELTSNHDHSFTPPSSHAYHDDLQALADALDSLLGHSHYALGTYVYSDSVPQDSPAVPDAMKPTHIVPAAGTKTFWSSTHVIVGSCHGHTLRLCIERAAGAMPTCCLGRISLHSLSARCEGDARIPKVGPPEIERWLAGNDLPPFDMMHVLNQDVYTDKEVPIGLLYIPLPQEVWRCSEPDDGSSADNDNDNDNDNSDNSHGNSQGTSSFFSSSPSIASPDWVECFAQQREYVSLALPALMSAMRLQATRLQARPDAASVDDVPAGDRCQGFNSDMRQAHHAVDGASTDGDGDRCSKRCDTHDELGKPPMILAWVPLQTHPSQAVRDTHQARLEVVDYTQGTRYIYPHAIATSSSSPDHTALTDFFVQILSGARAPDTVRTCKRNTWGGYTLPPALQLLYLGLKSIVLLLTPTVLVGFRRLSAARPLSDGCACGQECVPSSSFSSSCSSSAWTSSPSTTSDPYPSAWCLGLVLCAGEVQVVLGEHDEAAYGCMVVVALGTWLWRSVGHAREGAVAADHASSRRESEEDHRAKRNITHCTSTSTGRKRARGQLNTAAHPRDDRRAQDSQGCERHNDVDRQEIASKLVSSSTRWIAAWLPAAVSLLPILTGIIGQSGG